MTGTATHFKRKLALLLPDLLPGGAERVMLTLAGQFVDAGCAVDLVLLRGAGELMSIVPPEVRVFVVGMPCRGSGNVGLALTGLLGLVRYLRREHPQAVLSSVTGANIVTVLGRKIARVPARVILREASSTQNMRTRLRRILVRWLLPLGDGLVCVGEEARSEWAALIGTDRIPIVAIPNPLDVATISRLAGEDITHPWFRNGGPPIVIGLGRLAEAKDFASLIRAFAKVKAEIDARLVIVGDGPLKQSLRQLSRELGIESYVSLPGFMRNPYPLLRASSLFVLSSRWEGMPNALLEALALDIPIISTDCRTGPREVLHDGRFGRLVAVGDVDRLADAMIDVLRRRNGGQHNRDALARYAPAVVAQQYLSLLLD